MSVEPRSDDLFLPEFCDIRIVFSVVLGGELLACVLVLARGPEPSAASFWHQLALLSLFVQWVALTSIVVLCGSRRWLARLGNIGAGLASYGIVLAITIIVSELAVELVVRPGPEAGAVLYAFPGMRLSDDNLFVLRNVAVSAIVAAASLRYFYVQHQWKTNLESEARARVQALQSRIRPHFLFNSMNTIASLTRTDPARAEQVTEDLADLFRVSLADASVPIELGRELDVCRRYLRIEQLRLGERLRSSVEVDALPSDALVPGLLVQPLVENAVYHGVEPAAAGGEIVVRGERDGERLRIVVENTMPESSARRTREGHRMAFDNVAQRVGAFYREQASLRAEEDDRRYRVTLDIPYERSAGA